MLSLARERARAEKNELELRKKELEYNQYRAKAEVVNDGDYELIKKELEYNECRAQAEVYKLKLKKKELVYNQCRHRSRITNHKYFLYKARARGLAVEIDDGPAIVNNFEGDTYTCSCYNAYDERATLNMHRRLAVSDRIEDDFVAKVQNLMGDAKEGDLVMGTDDEVNLVSRIDIDIYKLIKPKYYNRVCVHTSHHDQPVVQGYKFNIFYPESVNKAKTPTFYIEKDGNNNEFCILRFHGCLPYQDIAFRIVNEALEYSSKKGYKFTFDRGILQLYFNLK